MTKCVGYPTYDNCSECELIGESCHPKHDKPKTFVCPKCKRTFDYSQPPFKGSLYCVGCTLAQKSEKIGHFSAEVTEPW